MEQLVDQIRTYNPVNPKEKATLNRLDPILKFVNDFSAIVAICFGTDAKIAALVWGSIRLILQLASSSTEALQDVIDVLEEISLTLPRFRQYERTLPIDENFENALINVYTEVICFYARTIHFYRSHPHQILRYKSWSTFQGDFGKTIQRIKRLSTVVEGEADIAKMKMDQDQYAEVLEVMKVLKESKITGEARKCFYVPHSVNPRFWGQQNVLRELERILAPADGDKRQRSFVLWGLGGVGKTQTALKFASEHRQDYDTVLWISAESHITSAQSFTEAARYLELLNSDDTEDSSSSMMKVKDFLLGAGE